MKILNRFEITATCRIEIKSDVIETEFQPGLKSEIGLAK